MPAWAQPQLPDNAIDGETIGSPELVAAACAEGAVTYYTAQREQDELAITQAFTNAFPCIRVTVGHGITAHIVDRLYDDRRAGRPGADVALITDEAVAQRLIDGRMLRRWMPAQAAFLSDEQKVDGWWYAASGSLMTMLVNTDAVPDGVGPYSWNDLLAPRWRGAIGMAPVTIGGDAWVQYDFMKTQLPPSYLRALAAQRPKMYADFEAVVDAVIRGDVPVGVVDTLDAYPPRVFGELPLRQVTPAEGLPYVQYPMMLLAGAAHPHAAELFGNWYLSRAGQTVLVQTRGAYSFRHDVLAARGNALLTGLPLWSPGRAAEIHDHDTLARQVFALFNQR